jgi:hypothetical protein
MPSTIVTGTPRDTGPCWSCGKTVGYVSVFAGRLPGPDENARHKMVAVDLRPRKFGTLAVLADGFRALDIEDGRLPHAEVAEIRSAIGSLFCRHWYSCDAQGMRRVEWTAAVVADGRPVNDPRRERIRAAKLAADRARDRSFFRP